MSNEIINESNFISLIGNDQITIYGGKNRYERHRRAMNSRLSIRGTQTGVVKA